MRFHSDLKFARFLPRAIFTPSTFRLVRWLFSQSRKRKPGDWQRIDLPNGQYLLVVGSKDPSCPVLMWLHGGGLVLGTPEQEVGFCSDIAKRANVTVVIPSYRLAPEHPYPSALNDLGVAYHWIAEQPWCDPDQLAIGGNSAGGGLAAGLLLTLQKASIRPCALILHQPMLDADTCSRPDPDPKSIRIWSAATNRFSWNAYLNGLSSPVPSAASPAKASDAELSEFPPTWLSIGTSDLFFDETAKLADRLSVLGKAPRFYRIEGAFHGFESIAPNAGITQKFMGDLSQWISNICDTKT